MALPYCTVNQAEKIAEEKATSKANECVKSQNGKVHIPYDSRIGGSDSRFPGYNFVLKGMYCYAEDGNNHFDDFIPCIMGNNPSTETLKYSIPIRDVQGRMFTWCSNRTFQTLLDAEVTNVAAVKYLIKDEVEKTLVLDLQASDMTYTAGQKTIALTDAGVAKVNTFFATTGSRSGVKAVKKITKVVVENTATGVMNLNMFNYMEGTAETVFENLQFIAVLDASTGGLVVTTLANGLNGFTLNDATFAAAFSQGVKITVTYTDIA